MKHLFSSLLSLVFPPKCAGCATRLSPDGGSLCPVCRARYENEKEMTCSVCASRLPDCLCLPMQMTRRGVAGLAKLIYYRPASSPATARMLYTIKHKNVRALQDFLGAELARSLSAAVAEGGEWVVTYPPRSRAALREDGFDHARALARSLAAQLDLPCVTALTRVGDGRAQKELSRTERARAAISHYRPRSGLSLAKKNVILCDDIATTGATLVAAARLLRQMGARRVLCATVALTPDKTIR